MCTATATAAVLATVFSNDWIAVGGCLAVLAILISARLFGFNETMLLVRHLLAVGEFLRSVPRVLRMKFVVVRLEAAVAAGQLDLWKKIIKRAQRLDGLEVEFACEHFPSGRKLTSLIWTSAAKTDAESSGEEFPVWQFCYGVPRGDGIETRIRATGRAPRTGGLPWLNELSEMLVALCENWPVAEQATIVVEEAPAVLTGPVDAPQILTAPWGASLTAEGPANPSRRIAESDAA